jgi:hypothetical protein
MFGFMLAAALLMVLLCIFSLIFRKEAIRAFPNPIRIAFWAYFALAIIIVIWSGVNLLLQRV